MRHFRMITGKYLQKINNNNIFPLYIGKSYLIYRGFLMLCNYFVEKLGYNSNCFDEISILK